MIRSLSGWVMYHVLLVYFYHVTSIYVDNKELKVERAKFEMKGEKYDPKLKPRKLRKKELEALKKKHDKMFAWVPDKLRGQRSKREKVSSPLRIGLPASFFSSLTV